MTDSYLEPKDTRVGQCALEFVQALVDSDFEKAASFIASDVREKYSVDELRQQYLAMIDYWDTPTVDLIEALESLDDWPNKQSSDLGWIYVSVEGEGFGEAVSVVITQDQKIRDIEWGRP